jgi:hypothetical protein
MEIPATQGAQAWLPAFGCAITASAALAIALGLGCRNGRPRFVVALSLTALGIGIYELTELLLVPAAEHGQVWFGFQLRGWTAAAAATLDVVVLWTGACGLWRLRAWGRLLAMVYLGYVIVSFLIWGVRGLGSEDVLMVMLWQVFVLPFVTFSLMYLHNGASYFGVDPTAGGESKTGWLY